MLDDLKYIHERDGQDALGVAQKQWQQFDEVFEFDINSTQIDNIVFAGMGGSALAASLSTSWPGYNVPFETVRDYSLPKYVDENTLFIASSYSGNTEETLSALENAQAKTKQIAVISSGGKLEEIATQKGYTLIKLPSGFQPRMAVFYSFKALISLLVKTKVLEQTALDELTKVNSFLQTVSETYKADRPTTDNLAKRIALDIVGKSAVIYSSSLFYPVAYKWKISINENAKNIAWCNQLPEFNHNEFLGWTSHPTDKPYAVVDIRSNLDNPRVQKRFEVSSKLLSGRRPEPIVVNAQGDNLLEQLLSTIVLGDYVSIYLALLNGVNPTPVDLIEKLKEGMKQ